ncbi:MAG: serine/threonine protein kinase [bacterium]|nr:serine/threonine protein kinase [bacterium]
MSSGETKTTSQVEWRDEQTLDLRPDQPTIAYAVADESHHVELVAGRPASLGTETTSLLQSRLRSVSLLIAIISAAVLVWAAINQGQEAFESVSVARNATVLRLLVSLAIFAWLYLNRELKQSTLRLIEYSLFGFLGLTWIYVRYNSIAIEAASANTAELLVGGRDSLIALMVWILLHGTLIPHQWRETAKVVLTMALAPAIVLVLLQVFRPDLQAQLAALNSQRNLSTILLGVGVASFIAIYTAGVLNQLRHQVHEARRYGQYQLLDKLGSGGMGEVYLAEHALMKRPCALKLIRPEAAQDPLARARFEHEVQITSSLTHPNTISIFDYGHTDDGTFYYAMEYLPGLSLAELLALGAMDAGRTIHLLRQVCSSLAEAHDAGLVHRDLKPANIFVSERGSICDFVKVLDFGLVQSNKDPGDHELTVVDRVSGTPLYMSPEQATAETGLDARSDIYALGAVAYHMLTGRPPFVGHNPAKIMMDHAHREVIPPSELVPSIPKDLEQVVLKCLEKNPTDRFENALVLERALRNCKNAGEWDATKAAIWWHDYTTRRAASALC